jgi:heme oxygenase (biliverdin-IX-beta and delta-forming)
MCKLVQRSSNEPRSCFIPPFAFRRRLGRSRLVSRPPGDDHRLLDALRRATRSAHDRLEARLPLLWPAASTVAYRRILEALFGFHAPLEARLTEVSKTFAPLAWEPRRKVLLLRTDLLALGATPAGIDALPRCEALPPVASAAEALGCLYVVEGATLGGRVIARRLRSVGVSPASGGRFFHGYGAATGRMWTQFVEHLEGSSGTRAQRERTVATAVDLFGALEGWLERTGALS